MMDASIALLIGLVAAGTFGGAAYVFFKFLKGSKRGEAPAQTEGIKMHEAPRNVEYERFKEADGKMVIIKKGTMAKNKKWLDDGREKRRFFPNHILTETIKGKIRYFYRFNEYYSESIENVKDTVPRYSEALESQLTGNEGTQLEKALGVVAGFIIDRPTAILLGAAMAMSIPIGIGLLPGILHPPNVVVRWVP